MLDRERLAKKARAYDIALEQRQLDQLAHYARLLEEWNKVMNLTAITAPEDVENKHIIDSMLLAVQPEVRGRMVDVGSGAGLPGLVCKIVKPELELTLMEPTKKRITFLEACRSELCLDFELLAERAEDAGKSAQREQYDVATARAVAALPQLCEYCLPLVRVGGAFLAMKGDAEEEARQAARAIALLGGEGAEQRRYTLPDGSRRTILRITKARATPAAYPRHGGAIKKKPL